jgi:hypothetical protein
VDSSACFAQPSGLATDGRALFVADSEGSSIRAIPLEGNERVVTVVGTAHLPVDRLFAFGDTDGVFPRGRVQHPLDLAWDGRLLYVADTYNNKLRAIDLATRGISSIVGDRQSGLSDAPARFDEPGGLSLAGDRLFVADTNNHCIRVVRLDGSYGVSTLEIQGLAPPLPPTDVKPSFAAKNPIKTARADVRPVDGAIQFTISVALPPDHKVNDMGPVRYWLESSDAEGPIDRAALDTLGVLPGHELPFEIRVPVIAAEGEQQLKLCLEFLYCTVGDGLCKIGSVAWSVPLRLSSSAAAQSVQLEFEPE